MNLHHARAQLMGKASRPYRWHLACPCMQNEAWHVEVMERTTACGP